MTPYLCPECLLPDPHHGDGDGDTTCRCDRCVYCNLGPRQCDCEVGYVDAYPIWDRVEAL